MGVIRIGISGWRYEPWRGVFYPKNLAQRRELEFASCAFPTIEINGSFSLRAARKEGGAPPRQEKRIKWRLVFLSGKIMNRHLTLCALILYAAALSFVHAAEKVIDIPTRSGVTQRFLLITPPEAKAAVVLFAGGHGGLQLNEAGTPRAVRNNFLVRSAPLFAGQGLAVAVIDAPSDRQSYPHLQDFRHSAEHATDIKAVIAWLRENAKVPVWLIGTSRGTQSVAGAATRLAGSDGPDGIVLTSTLLTDRRTRPVPDMGVESIKLPVLVVHHEQDGCRQCLFSDMPRLMSKLSGASKKELVTFRGGENHGNPCEALAYHGYNGLEKEVVERIAAWVIGK